VLRDIPDPPALLFAAGRLELGREPAVAMVGSRTHTRYGGDVCRYLAGGAARAGLAVVSGMARGIDALAHAAALDAGGGTVGILGNGLGVIYPSANRALYERVQARGLFLTEFPPGERPNAGSFQRRNRLISGLARVTVVIEAREKSGALITVDCALAQGREVLAVPGPITSPTSVGCNRLIQSGAKPVLGLRDILEEYGVDLPSAASPDAAAHLSETERAALSALAAEPRHADEIAEALRLSTADTLATLTALEIQGFVAALPGKRFTLASGVAIES
jgi:DNA processing protein